MKTLKRLIIAGLAVSASFSVAAQPSVNEMQDCQAFIDFVDRKMTVTADVYEATDLNLIRKGLQSYNVFIQEQIVSPGILAYSQGDTAKAEYLQQQIDVYKVTVVDKLGERYPERKLLTDFAFAINECAKKALPNEETQVQQLKTSLDTIIKLAQKA
ncbi:hypothetical protein [Marinomonas epiphytica]